MFQRIVSFKRIPGIIYRKRYIFISAIVILVSSVILLLHWGVLCTNLQAWQHVSNLCELHRQGKAIGSLCKALCIDNQFHTLTCHPFHVGKDSVFSAVWTISGNPRVVFKAVRLGSNEEKDYLSENPYPTEDQFESMLADLVSNKLNITVSKEKLRRLGRIGPSAVEGLPGGTLDRRHHEMEAAWLLLQGHEYLVSILFEEREVFPRVLGTCGPYFASEWVDPLEWEDTKEEWINRVHAAVLVLELLEALEDTPPVFRLCDVRPGHFGITSDGSKAKVLDSDAALPHAVANQMTGDNSPCTKDEDCHYFDCKSKCTHGKCTHPVLNNNLQVVCEKVFLSQVLPGGAVILPGLLMSEHTPSSLSVLLRLCVNHSNDEGAEYVRKRLYATLSQMEMALFQMVLLKYYDGIRLLNNLITGNYKYLESKTADERDRWNKYSGVVQCGQEKEEGVDHQGH
ncbi:hypothetical protein J437_LFUL014583 [Ladona fulva]|uniref:FAM69 N-terminal domain-containing protein n=1 Tax=Ladona fulva TaxID=123851 RepID=A0A8K0NVS0_LADFU|nr:hypothetical protein J437_LFUL014583 [Ladona fulva]